MPITTIVAALALEDPADPVLARATQLAQQHQARLIIVHAVEGVGDAESITLPPEAQPDRLVAAAAAALTATLTTTDHPTTPVVQVGRAHRIIAAVCRDHQADLLIIGPGKVSGLRDRLFGSTADRVTRRAGCPVLITRPPVIGDYRHAVVAVDFSAPSLAALTTAATLATGATIELAHAVEAAAGVEEVMLTAGSTAAELVDFRRRQLAIARQQLQDLARQADQPRHHVAAGPPDKVLLRLARRRRADLIAMGREGRGAVGRLMLGSVTQKVLTTARCDVLVVPPPAGG